MRLRIAFGGALGALALVGVVAAAWWHAEAPVLGDPPAAILHDGCRYRATAATTTLAEAAAHEHGASYYATTPFREVGRTPAGRPYYGLTVFAGDGRCSASPRVVYLARGRARVQAYERGGGP